MVQKFGKLYEFFRLVLSLFTNYNHKHLLPKRAIYFEVSTQLKQLRKESLRSWVQILFKPEFFSGFLFATA